LLATGQRGDADVIVWDITSGRILYKFEEHDGTVSSLTFTDDERVLVSVGSEDGVVIAWDLSSGAMIGRRRQDPIPILSLASGGFVKDVKGRDTGLYQFAAAGSKGVTLWGINPLDGRMEYDKLVLSGLQRDFLCAVFAPLPSYPWIYLGTTSGDIVIIHTRSRSVHSSFFASGGGITSLSAVVSDGGSVILIAGSGDGTIHVYRHAASSLEHELMLSAASARKSGAPALTLERSLTVSGAVWSISPLPIMSLGAPLSFLVGTSSGCVYRAVASELRDTSRAGAPLAAGEPPGGLTGTLIRQAHGVAVDPLPAAVAALTVVAGGSVTAATASTTVPGKSRSLHAASATSLLAGLPGPLAASARVPDILVASFANGISDRFVTAGADGYVRAWDAGDFSCISATTAKGAGYPTCIAFVNDYFISGWQDGNIRAYLTDMPGAGSRSDAGAYRKGVVVDDPKFIWALPDAHAGREGGVTALVIAHNQRFFVTGGANGSIRVWDIRTRELISQFKEHKAAITELVILPNDTTLLSVSRDRSLITWDLRTERRVSVHTLKLGGMNAVDAAPDCSLIITAGQDKNLTYWDVRSPAPVKVIPYPLNPVNGAEAEPVCLAMAHSRSIFVSGGNDAVVRVWDVASGSLIAEGIGHSGTVRDVQFSPDDKQIISCGSDGAILVWNVY
jgi:WD40 repeat protein